MLRRIVLMSLVVPWVVLGGLGCSKEDINPKATDKSKARDIATPRPPGSNVKDKQTTNHAQ